MTALLGANGAGKSTLCSIAAGLLGPTAGTVWLRGREVATTPTFQRARDGVLLVPEARGIFPGLTVEENLALVLRSEELREKAYKRFRALDERRRQPAGLLSGGEQQMLSIVPALVSPPAVLIADEPTLGLAPLLAELVMDAILEIRSLGSAVLLVEEHAENALKVADVIAFMELGRVTWMGPRRTSIWACWSAPTWAVGAPGRADRMSSPKQPGYGSGLVPVGLLPVFEEVFHPSQQPYAGGSAFSRSPASRASMVATTSGLLSRQTSGSASAATRNRDCALVWMSSDSKMSSARLWWAIRKISRERSMLCFSIVSGSGSSGSRALNASSHSRSAGPIRAIALSTAKGQSNSTSEMISSTSSRDQSDKRSSPVDRDHQAGAFEFLQRRADGASARTESVRELLFYKAGSSGILPGQDRRSKGFLNAAPDIEREILVVHVSSVPPPTQMLTVDSRCGRLGKGILNKVFYRAGQGGNDGACAGRGRFSAAARHGTRALRGGPARRTVAGRQGRRRRQGRGARWRSLPSGTRAGSSRGTEESVPSCSI